MSSYVVEKSGDAFGPTMFRYAGQPTRVLPQSPTAGKVIPRAMSLGNSTAPPTSEAVSRSILQTQTVLYSEPAVPIGQSTAEPKPLKIMQWAPHDTVVLKYHREVH
jgi:hypothetical protein